MFDITTLFLDIVGNSGKSIDYLCTQDFQISRFQCTRNIKMTTTTRTSSRKIQYENWKPPMTTSICIPERSEVMRSEVMRSEVVPASDSTGLDRTTSVRNSFAGFMRQFSSFSDPNRTNVLVYHNHHYPKKTEETHWDCLQSKACVCILLSLFILVFIGLGAVIAIYFTKSDILITNCSSTVQR